MSAVRVALGVLRRETFGAEATVAVLLVLVLSMPIVASFRRP